MRYFMNEVRVVHINEEETVAELRNFVRYANGTWKARGGFHDDRVMAMLYALFILEKEITERERKRIWLPNVRSKPIIGDTIC